MHELILVEENPTLGNALQSTLEVAGFSVRIARDAATGVALARRARPALVIVDVTLGGQQGYQLVRTLRGDDHRIPILAIATTRDQGGLLNAFRAGADDCMCKPVDGGELTERAWALVRRAVPDRASLDAAPLQLGAITIWPTMRRGCVVSREELLRTVWGWYPDTVTHTVDVHVSRLRRQIEPDPRVPRYILTVRPLGFLIPGEMALHASA